MMPQYNTLVKLGNSNLKRNSNLRQQGSGPENTLNEKAKRRPKNYEEEIEK